MTSVSGSPDPSSAHRATRWSGRWASTSSRCFNVPLLAGQRGIFDRAHAEDVPMHGSSRSATPAGRRANCRRVRRRRTSSWIARSSRRLASAHPRRRSTSLCTPGATGCAVAAPPPQPPFRISASSRPRVQLLQDAHQHGRRDVHVGRPISASRSRASRAADLDAGLAGIDAAWKQLAPNVAINRRFLDEIFERAYANYVRVNHLFGTLSVMAFAICVAGLFGMAVFVASRRRREIGVRKTLGATTNADGRAVARGVSRNPCSSRTDLHGPRALAARAYLNQFSQSIPLTPWPFVLSVAITIAIAWLAVVGQTLRAARTTPAEVLRNE